MTSVQPTPSLDADLRLPPSPRVPAAPLRIALVGAGKMGHQHARAMQRVPELGRLVAAVDPSPDARRVVEQVFPGTRAYATLDELLAAGGVDVVHVCTAPDTHAAVAERAIEAGCHVYVEKPFVPTVDEARRLLAKAAERGLKVCAGHQLLHEPPARRLRELLPALGRVVHVESYFAFRTVRRAPGGRAPLRADLQLLDILPHPVYLMLDMLERLAPEGRTELAGLEVGERGTVHALVRRGDVRGTLVVTLEGRPVDNWLRVVGTNGMAHADFVRGTVQRLIGPGTSGIDKALAPYRLAWQGTRDTTAALTERVRRRQRSYPGLAELFGAFYESIRDDRQSPTTPDQLLETTRLWAEVAEALRAQRAHVEARRLTATPRTPDVVVTGGTGFLGKEIVRTLVDSSRAVRVLARREPAEWERVEGADYVVCDLGDRVPAEHLRGAGAVIHAAAETAGGWTEHERNSIGATENVIRAASEAGVRTVIHVSSLAVIAGGRGTLDERSALVADEKGRGPYVWGKLVSERRAAELGKELGLEVRIVRPGALVDSREFDPPGRLGKLLGPVFVAAGWPGETIGVTDVRFAAEVLARASEHPEVLPPVLNLLDPELPTRRDLVGRLKTRVPDVSVVWLPTPLLKLLSLGAVAAQKVLRPGKPAMNVAAVFAPQRYDTSAVRRVATDAGAGAERPAISR